AVRQCGDCGAPRYLGVRGGANLGQEQTQDMPTTGSATFTGGTVGYLGQPISLNSRHVGEFYGDASITANFASGTVTGSLTDLKAYFPRDHSTLLGTINDIGF